MEPSLHANNTGYRDLSIHAYVTGHIYPSTHA
jgi:hypothetical protein